MVLECPACGEQGVMAKEVGDAVQKEYLVVDTLTDLPPTPVKGNLVGLFCSRSHIWDSPITLDKREGV